MTARLPDDFRPVTPSRRLVVRSSDGTRLVTEVHGDADGDPSRPTVVLVHGWTCAASFWVRIVHRLRGEARVVVYDQRGHGRSQGVNTGGFTPSALADDLAAVLAETVPAGRRAVVAGHSMGAMALVALAGRHPDVLHDRVGAALLASTGVAELLGRMAVLPARKHRGLPEDPLVVGTAPATATRGSRAREQVLRSGMADARALHRLPLPVARAAVNRITLAPSAGRAERTYNADLVLACPLATYAGFADMLAGLDLLVDLGRLDVPTLVLVGTHDRLTPPWHAHRMVAALPRPVGLVEIPGAGHMTPLDTPDAVADAIRRLIPLSQEATVPPRCVPLSPEVA